MKNAEWQMYGITRLDGIINEYVKVNLEIMNLAKKMRENRLIRFGYVEK